ncbi:response regulator transcription factor [uncultured Treponema sp.]|uniref:response regulator transcription factor n=1 Tax=uncultured Treponema sp. TaxID=162155 RepID=UPI0025FEC4FF|nr:response regulator transcription factor [uncultured Treponema sp.]
MACVIIVEDNSLIRDAVSGYLKLDGYKTLEFGGVSGVLDAVKRETADLAILDVMLPDGSGFALAKEIRATSDIPLIFLTAKDSESDRILGFELGADDYICKPFSAKELVLRVHALLRRSGKTDSGKSTASGEWKSGNSTVIIDEAKHSVSVDGNAAELTSTEWKILLYLASNAGQVVSREQLLGECLNYFFEGSERTIDTHMANLRSKIGQQWISTVRGFGYRFSGIKADSKK